jgi:hypothetical protein
MPPVIFINSPKTTPTNAEETNMATDKRPASSRWYIKVYLASELEATNIKLRATLLGKTISRHARDLLVLDLHSAGLKPFLDTTEGLAHYQRTGEQLVIAPAAADADQPLYPQNKPPTDEELAELTRKLEAEEAEEPTLDDFLADVAGTKPTK